MEKLLKLLEENARYTTEELAVMLGESAESVAKEMDELEQKGIICGYKPLVNWDKFDDRLVTALIELRVTPEREAGFDDVAERVMRYPEVETVYLMSGGFDLMVIVKGQSFRQVAMFVAKRLATMERVQSTGTHFVLHRYKELGVELDAKTPDDRGWVSV